MFKSLALLCLLGCALAVPTNTGGTGASAGANAGASGSAGGLGGLTSGLTGGGGLPVVGGLTSGLTGGGSPLGAVGGITSGLTGGGSGGLPVVGGLLGGGSGKCVLDAGGLLGGLPLVGNVLGNSQSGALGSLPLVGSLPVVGGLAGGSGGANQLPVVGAVLGGGSSQGAGSNCVQKGLSDYLNSVASGQIDQGALKSAVAKSYGVDESRVTVNVQTNVNLGDLLKGLLGGQNLVCTQPIVLVCVANLNAAGQLCNGGGAQPGLLNSGGNGGGGLLGGLLGGGNPVGGLTGGLPAVGGLTGGLTGGSSGSGSGDCHQVSSGIGLDKLTGLIGGGGPLGGLLGNIQLNVLQSKSTPLVLAIVQNGNIYLVVVV